LYTTRVCYDKRFQAVPGKEFAFEESETIKNLELKLFNKNKNKLEEMINRVSYNNFTLQRNNLNSQRSSHLQNLNQFGIEKFIMIDIADAYLSESTNKTQNIDTNLEFVPPTVDFSNIGKNSSILSTVLDYKDTLFLGNRLYFLEPNGHEIKIKGRKYNLQEFANMKKLITWYDKKLEDTIHSNIKENSVSFTQAFGDLSRESEKVEKIKRLINSRKRGRFSFIKKSDSRYTLLVDVPPYIMEKDQRYYVFDENKIETNLIYQNNLVQIESKPDVLHRPYLHPFVFTDKSRGLCYGDFNPGSIVSFSRPYTLNFPNLAFNIARVIKEGTKLLTSSYVGYYGPGGKTPVRYIQRCNQLTDVNNGGEAKEYAIRKGIDINRIFKQDRGS
jgi:hypothetical protein